MGLKSGSRVSRMSKPVVVMHVRIVHVSTPVQCSSMKARMPVELTDLFVLLDAYGSGSMNALRYAPQYTGYYEGHSS